MKKTIRRVVCTVILVGCIQLSGCSSVNDKLTKTQLGMNSIEQLDYEGALSYFDEAESGGENKELLYRGRGMAYMGIADYEKAIKNFELALTQANGKVSDLEYDISYYLATALYKSGDLDGTIDTYTAILNLKPKSADAYCLRGRVRLEKGLYDDAVRDFNSAVDFDKNNPDMYVRIFESMAQNGYKEQGHDYLDQAMKLDTKITDFQKGKLYYCLEDYENARDCFEKARKTDEDGVVLYLGRTYQALGDMNYAASLYKTYLEKNGDDVTICNQLGLCQLANKKYEDALAAFEKGLEVENSNMLQSLKYNQIVAYEYMANFKKAAVLMESYLKLYPDDKVAKREYEFLKTR
ncbi:MAG: tetratricopeptide repeat protein [Lachnospiraceae bacterium]|nr:tetratricopeptide repeat protein [Lachnospiraceae bacterium]